MTFKISEAFRNRPHPGDVIPGSGGRVMRRWAHDVQGRILQAPNGMVYTPYEWDGKFWYVVVLLPPADSVGAQRYPRGGYNLIIGNADVESDLEISIQRLEDY